MRVATLLALGALAALGGCATTRFKSTWAEPNAAPLHFYAHKVLALVDTVDDRWNRPAEIALAAQLCALGADGIPAHTVLSDRERIDPDARRARLAALGIPGVVVVRIIRVQSEIPAEAPSYVGTTHGGAFWDAWYDDSWRQVDLSAPPPHGDTRVYLETSIYRAGGAELVWSGESRTRNPASIASLMRQLVHATTVQLDRAGLIAR